MFAARLCCALLEFAAPAAAADAAPADAAMTDENVPSEPPATQPAAAASAPGDTALTAGAAQYATRNAVTPEGLALRAAAMITRLRQYREAPFTTQRFAELVLEPRKDYARMDKYLRALEKMLLVSTTVHVSPRPAPPPPPPAVPQAVPPAAVLPQAAVLVPQAAVVPQAAAQAGGGESMMTDADAGAPAAAPEAEAAIGPPAPGAPSPMET